MDSLSDFLDLRVNSFNFSPFNMMLIQYDVHMMFNMMMAFLKLRFVLSIPNFVKFFFYCEWMETFQYIGMSNFFLDKHRGKKHRKKMILY